MMNRSPRLRIDPAILMTLPLGRQLSILALLLALMLVAMGCAMLLDPMPTHHLFTLGAGAESINVLTLLFMLWVVQCSYLYHQTHRYLSCGLAIWLVSGVIDLMDEAYLQPMWLATLEDGLRTLGMLVVAWGILLVLRQISMTHAQLTSLAMSDELTSLSNRRSFRQVLDSQAGEGSSLILLDLDHFKRINDHYGHAAGDGVLQAFGQLLRDVCPPGGLAARLGGEEFAMLLPGVSGSQACKLAEHIRSETETLGAGEDIRFTVSLAVGTCRAGEEVGEWIRRTDLALYRAKERGRNRVELA
ncbi:GGDEF domain-containing protein [Aeromonas crassostreae]